MFGILKKKLNNFGDKLKNNLNKKADSQKLKRETEKKIGKKDEKKEKVNREETNENKKHSKRIIENKEISETKKEIVDSIRNSESFEEPVRKDDSVGVPVRKDDSVGVPVRKDDSVGVPVRNRVEKRELKSRVRKGAKLKGLFSKKIEIKEQDINDLVWELELSLIESDVEQETAEEITKKIKERLVGKVVEIKNLDKQLKEEIKEILYEMMYVEKINLLEEINKEKPYKILFLGPNGAGKTTSIAKLTYLLQKMGKKCVWAASDTFRSGAIHQLNEHAEKLNVRLVKQEYGADPTAVAFDAVKSAEANNSDVVIIDSAGRQETNKNLMEELNKLERVIKPNLKIYVGEAYTGQGLLEMAREFDEKVGIDGFILTKIDTDAKGGTTISLLYKLKKPILYVGTGQGYSDFEEFNENFVINRII
jgi:fused signal recognition particle receptor